ncbi:trehalase [Mantella aurantiaca]
MHCLGCWLTFFVIFFALQEKDVNGNLPPPCPSQIFCTGDLLHHVQMAKIFEDDKHFVDMSLRDTPVKVMKKFKSLYLSPPSGEVDRDKLIAFLNTSFNQPGTELEQWNPPDWHENPKFLSGIANAELRKWALSLTSLWKSLGRKIKEEVNIYPERYSQIYVPNPLIVPGGRFREFYYWDSYWVINGLLLSEMTQTARGMIENFLYMVQRYGMIPNGGRIYYMRRSQPPFLTLMMESYMDSQKNLTFLRESIPLLVKEYDFWMNNRSTSVSINGTNYTLNRYYVEVGGPRPESYSDDYELAENLTTDAKPLLYSDIAAAAESGWDFSTRWFYGSTNTLLDTKTSSAIPVDLNAILCRVERVLAKFYTDLDMPEMASRFSDALNQRLKAVQAVLWDQDLGVWLDYNLEQQKRNPNFYPSNLSPLWASCYDDTAMVDSVVSYLEKSGALSYKNGLPTSLINSGQQWDFPNGWPPLQHMVIEGLEKTQSAKAKEIAFKLAQKWVVTNYNAFKEYDAMFEKYHVDDDGKPGGGGEYEVQLGFGWSNGVILQLLDFYGSHLTSSAIISSLSFPALLFPIIILTIWA